MPIRQGPGSVAEIVLDFPPVNALPIAGWNELAESGKPHMRAAAALPKAGVRCVRG